MKPEKIVSGNFLVAPMTKTYVSVLVFLLHLAMATLVLADQSEPPPWQVKGFAAALEDRRAGTVQAALQSQQAAYLLKAMGSKGKKYVPLIAAAMNDEGLQCPKACDRGAGHPRCEGAYPRHRQAPG